MVELVLTAVVALAAIAAVLLATRLAHDHTGVQIVIAVCLVLMIWLPPGWRALIVGLLALALVSQHGGTAALVTLGLVAAAAVLVPGGVSALLLAVLALVGVHEIAAARRHLRRIARAAALVAGARVEHDVELTGTARAVTPLLDPHRGEPCALWSLSSQHEVRHTSTTLIELRGAGGSAIVDPAAVTIEWKREGHVLEPELGRKLAAELGLALAADASVELRVLPEGAEAYVIGRPTWEHAPAGAGLYRDAPTLPTFRSTPEHGAWFADRSEAELRTDFRWAAIAWSLWGAVSLAIAIAQLAGWA